MNRKEQIIAKIKLDKNVIDLIWKLNGSVMSTKCGKKAVFNFFRYIDYDIGGFVIDEIKK